MSNFREPSNLSKVIFTFILITLQDAKTEDERNNDPSIHLILFNRNHPDGVILTPSDPDQRLKELFIEKTNLIISIHGWKDNEKSPCVQDVREAYLSVEKDSNVVEVGWGELSVDDSYAQTSQQVDRVGKYVGRMIVNLLNAGVTRASLVHLTGHSLGSQIAGVAGGYVRDSGHGLVARITGLDPAGPLIQFIRSKYHRLDKKDAEFVDVIHSCAGVSVIGDIGHADFYPNGGFCDQPGCSSTSADSKLSCSHYRSCGYYVESVYDRNSFPSLKCNSFREYRTGRCRKNQIAFLGAYLSSSIRGSYYLTTNARPPYGRRNINNP